MANIFQTLGRFTVARLRSTDTTYLSGAVKSSFPFLPVAIATGPIITGPVSTGLVDGETWGVAVPVPSTPDVMWVVAYTGYNMKLEAAVSKPSSSFLVAFMDVADQDNLKGPILGGMGLAPVQFVPGAAGGTFTTIIASNTPSLKSTALWVPLDPDDTSAGWNFGVTFEAGTTGPGVDDIEIDLRGVVLVGYPVNAWNTGALWAAVGARGS